MRPPAQNNTRPGQVRLVGAGVEVGCGDGVARRYVNLDYAASTPALTDVWEAVCEFLPWYSSVHRGTGVKSRVSTEAYEDARAAVAEFVGAAEDHAVVLVRNTTEALNVLSTALPPGTRILSTPVEHHANLLPWRRHGVRMLPFPESADDLCDACDRALADASPRIGLVAVTGASNVTGEVWPIARLAGIAHRHGARLCVDAAQLAAHRPIDMTATDIDFLAFSGHKLYAPFGAGALVARHSALAGTAPLLRGGGAVKLVTLDEVVWADAPDRHEAGSPNVIGAVALGAACRALQRLGMDAVAAHERTLGERLSDALAGVAGLEPLTLWAARGVDRVGVASFNLDGHRHPLLAAALSAEHGIGVRNGCFCAHPLITRLLGISGREVDGLRDALEAGRRPRLPGAVRASFGLGTTTEDIDRLAGALNEIALDGPRLRYVHDADHDEFTPSGPSARATKAASRRHGGAAGPGARPTHHPPLRATSPPRRAARA